MKDIVQIERFRETSDLYPLLASMLSALDVGGEISSSTRIAIKPNFTYPWYKPGVTTSPQVLRAVVAALKDYTSHIMIVESDGGSNAWSAAQAFEGHGVPTICSDLGVKSAGLTQTPRRPATALVADTPITLELPTLLLDETDYFVTLPVPKVHVMTTVSLGFKNQWGCIPDVKRLRHHPQFTRKLIAANKLLRTELAVFDGTFFLDKRGPMDGTAIPMNLLIAGQVGTATCACCELMEVLPESVEHLRLAISEGLMPERLQPEQCTFPINEHKRSFRLEPRSLDKITRQIFKSRALTNLLYCSPLAKPAHDLLYLLRGKPRDFTPIW
jgi:uncharacterized protein (DUF362 family)